MTFHQLGGEKALSTAGGKMRTADNFFKVSHNLIQPTE